LIEKKTGQELPQGERGAFNQKEFRSERSATWEAIFGLLGVGVLYAALPAPLIIGPSWLLLAIETLLLLPIGVSLVRTRGLSHKVIHILLFLLLGVTALALAIGIALLIVHLNKDQYGIYLLRSAALLWASNVLVFSLWYWQIDGGGPVKRHLTGHQAADFLFPQQVDGNTSGWVPRFLDYLFLGFTGSTAFSPTDTMPLTRSAKVLMMLEAILSLTIIVILAGRAVNIL
jgi:hypothetical protein